MIRTKRWLTKCILLVLLVGHTRACWADVLGSFANVQNLPGYIDTDPDSPWYTGPLDKDRHAMGMVYQTPSQIVAEFFAQGQLDLMRMQSLLAEVSDYRKNSFIAYCMENLPNGAVSNDYCLGSVDDAKLLEKWDKKEVNLVLQYILVELNKAIQLAQGLKLKEINTAAAEPFLETFFGALNLFDAVKPENWQQGRYTGANSTALYNVNNLLVDTEHQIKEGRPEAANLLVPKAMAAEFPGQRFLSLADLRRLSKQGYDLSLLEPANSGIWRKPHKAVSRYDLTRYNGEAEKMLAPTLGEDAAHEMLDPATAIDLVYDPDADIGGLTPKLYATAGEKKWKVKFLTDKTGSLNTTNLMSIVEMVMNAAEVNVENVANNLAAAIGYTIDPTYYKRKARLFFPAEVYEHHRFDEAYEEMIRALDEHFLEKGRSTYTRSAMQNVRTDPVTGRRYIELRGINLEKRGDKESDINVGFFQREGFGKGLQREHRALLLFMAWISDIDPKNENVRLKMIPVKDPEGVQTFRIAYSNSDMGMALGLGLPNYLPPEFIKGVKRRHGRLHSFAFEFRKIWPVKLLDAITIDDARWLARRIGQITPEQMYKAFKAAGFPRLVAKVFAQKMMGRRNQLLEAVGLMGETMIDDEGRSITFAAEEAYAGFIPGYERFFKDKLLTDPNNELFDPELESFPRYWGTYWNPRVKDKPQTIFWRHMGVRLLNESTLLLVNTLEPGAYYTGYGPTFAGISVYRGGAPFAPCASGGCFFQGVGFGVGTFAPFRFLVDNPDRESPEPLLVVDIFRIGLSAGATLGDLSPLSFGGGAHNVGLRVGGRGFRIYEFMKIRAVSDFDAYVKNYGEAVKKVPKLIFEKAKRQFIESMEPGDTMVLSTYLGTQGIFQYAPLFGTSFVSPQVTLHGEAVLVNRATIHKESEEMMLANWSRIKYAAAFGGTGLWAGITLNVAGASHRSTQQSERTFAFDLRRPDEHEMLLANLQAHYPDDVPEELGISKRERALKENSSRLGFLALIGRDKVTRRIEVDLYDYLNHTRQKDLAYEKVYSHNYMKGLVTRLRTYTYKASLNDKNDLFVKVGMDMHFPEARERHMPAILEHIGPMVPDDFIVFNTSAVKRYLGDVDFHGRTVFSHAALDYVFAVDPREVCEAFVRTNSLGSPAELCSYEPYRGDPHLRCFMRDFADAKRRYEDMGRYRGYPPAALHEERQTIFQELKDFVDVFAHYNKKYNIVRVFRSLIPPETYYQDASLSSSLAGFPNDDDFIEISLPSRGGFEPSLRHLADVPEDIYEVFSDALHRKIARFFYNPTPPLVF